MAKPELIYVGTADGLATYSYNPDGGLWQRIAHSLRGQPIRAIDALDADTLLVGLADGTAQESFDGGRHWRASLSGPPSELGLLVATRNGPVPVANPRLQGAVAYARLQGKPPILIGAAAGGTMIFRSNDDGIHWEPAALPSQDVGRITTIVPAKIPQSAWAGTEQGWLLRSSNYGGSWQQVAQEAAAIYCLVAL